MREIRDHRVTFAELKGRLKVDHDAKFFAFLLRRLGLKDVRLDGDGIAYASFIPLETLLGESIGALEREGVKPGPCARCGEYFDLEHDAGVFKNPVAFTGFICRGCAERLSAWEFCEKWLEL
jgi:hypothetical protein